VKIGDTDYFIHGKYGTGDIFLSDATYGGATNAVYASSSATVNMNGCLFASDYDIVAPSSYGDVRISNINPYKSIAISNGTYIETSELYRIDSQIKSSILAKTNTSRNAIISIGDGTTYGIGTFVNAGSSVGHIYMVAGDDLISDSEHIELSIIFENSVVDIDVVVEDDSSEWSFDTSTMKTLRISFPIDIEYEGDIFARVDLFSYNENILFYIDPVITIE
jgi:hypothetical protein